MFIGNCVNRHQNPACSGEFRRIIGTGEGYTKFLCRTSFRPTQDVCSQSTPMVVITRLVVARSPGIFLSRIIDASGRSSLAIASPAGNDQRQHVSEKSVLRTFGYDPRYRPH
jgi:hypothetical protein